MNASKEKGTAFESGVRMYLRWALDDPNIDRAPLHSAGDIGDISGVHIGRRKIAVECKSRKQLAITEGLTEAEREAANLGTTLSLAVFKLDGRGTTTLKGMAVQLAVMNCLTWETLGEIGHYQYRIPFKGLSLLDTGKFSTMRKLIDDLAYMEKQGSIDGLLTRLNGHGRVVMTTLEHAAGVINLKRPLGPKQPEDAR